MPFASQSTPDFKGDHLSVKMFGAVGDGVHDDTAAIQAAATYLSSHGGVLHFPSSLVCYKITAGILFAACSNVTITGPDGAEIRFADGATDTVYAAWPNYGKDSLFRFVGGSNITVEGITLNGNLSERTANAGAESFNSDIFMAGVAGITIRNTRLLGAMTDGILVETDSDGVKSTRVLICDNTIIGARRNNISLCGYDGAIIRGNCLQDSGSVQGTNPKANLDVEPYLGLGYSNDLLVDGNRMTGAAGANCMSVGGTGNTNVRIVHNLFQDNDGRGLGLENYAEYHSANENVTVTGNVFKGHVTGASVGVHATYKSTNLVQGNTFSGNLWGMSLYAIDGLQVHGNCFIENLFGGILGGRTDEDYGFTRLDISGNVFVDNSSAAGAAAGANYAVDLYPQTPDALLVFNGNTLLNTPSHTPLMQGAKIESSALALANGNLGKNLPTGKLFIMSYPGWVNWAGFGNWTVDETSRWKAAFTGEANFSDSNGGGRLLIGDRYHYADTPATYGHPPNSGTWEKGDIAYNTNPVAGSPVGWVATVAGTPGAWKPFGNISGPIACGTHADRLSSDASMFEPGAGFYETDRTLLYVAMPYTATGHVNTSGTAVSWVSEDTFSYYWPGRTITINGVDYVIGSVESVGSLTLTESAGTQSNVDYSAPSSKWFYATGTCYSDSFPTDLLGNDIGLMFHYVTQSILYRAVSGIPIPVLVPVFSDPHGTGSPEGVLTAAVGTIYRRTDGGAGTTLYVKEVGSGNTGWKAVLGPVDLTTDVIWNLPLAHGGTDATDAAGARASLSAALATAVGAHTMTIPKLTAGGAAGSISWNADGVVSAYVDPT